MCFPDEVKLVACNLDEFIKKVEESPVGQQIEAGFEQAINACESGAAETPALQTVASNPGMAQSVVSATANTPVADTLADTPGNIPDNLSYANDWLSGQLLARNNPDHWLISDESLEMNIESLQSLFERRDMIFRALNARDEIQAIIDELEAAHPNLGSR